MQGWRIDMEDAHVVKISMSDKDPMRDWSFFAVFDGHAGSCAAEDASEKILHTLMEMPHFTQVAEKLSSNGGVLCEKTRDLLESGIKGGFLHLDQKIRERFDADDNKDRSGTTAVCAIVTQTHLIIANLGDSRAVLSKKGGHFWGTEDHKPTNDRERKRIVNAGGSVMIQRINGSLAVSRALGDFEYKATQDLAPALQQVSAEPDVYFIEREKDHDQFLVLACDGIYDVMSNNELCQFIEGRLEIHGGDLPKVCNQVLDACLHKGSRDNMTFLLVCFESAPCKDDQKARSDEELMALLASSVSKIIDEQMEQNADKVEKAEDVPTAYIYNTLISRHEDILPEGHTRLVIRTLIENVIAQKDKQREKDEDSTAKRDGETTFPNSSNGELSSDKH